MNPTPQTPDELAKAVRDALESLKQRRPIFHSEADLQLALFRTMTHGGAFSRVVMEQPFSALSEKGKKGKECRVDIYANGVALELKEKSRKCEIEWEGELFNLCGGSSFDGSKVTESKKAVERIVRVVDNEPEVKIGFAVILTSRELTQAREDDLLSGFHDNARLEKFEWSTLEDNRTPYETNCLLVEVRPKP